MIREGKIIFALTSSYFSSRNIAFSYIFMTTIIIIENWLLSVQDLCAFCVFFVGIFVEQIEKTNDKKEIEQMENGTHSKAFIIGSSKILITHHSKTLQLRREDVQSLQLVPHIFPI